MIDKDQQIAIQHMIKEIYSPVILKAVINLVLVDIAQIVQGSGQTTTVAVNKILHTDICQRALIDSLIQEHAPRCHDIIAEIIKQYGLHLIKDEIDYYHEKMGAVFDVQVEYVASLLRAFKYDYLYTLSKGAVN